MKPKDFLSIALYDAQLPNEAHILDTVCDGIPDFIVRLQGIIHDASEALRIAQDHISDNLSYVAKVETTVNSDDCTQILYVGCVKESAVSALNDFVFAPDRPEWEYTSCTKKLETWCYGKLHSSIDCQ